MVLKRIADNIWLICACRNLETFRAMKGRLLGNGAGLRSLQFRALERPVVYRPGTTDIFVAWELFRGREYAVGNAAWPFRTVVDCGANVGMFLAWVVANAGTPLERYVGIEADESSFTTLQRQLESLSLGSRYTILKAAVWKHDGEAYFDSTGPSWAHHVSESGGQSVVARTVKSILVESGIKQCDLLKLDIEGGELTVLPTIEQWGHMVRAIVAELHGGADFAWFESTVEAAGFRAYPAGKLFRKHPGALREDEIATFQREGLLV